MKAHTPNIPPIPDTEPETPPDVVPPPVPVEEPPSPSDVPPVVDPPATPPIG